MLWIGSLTISGILPIEVQTLESVLQQEGDDGVDEDLSALWLARHHGETA